MSSGSTPSRIHQAASVESRASVVVANGTLLSVRMRCGSPYSRKRRAVRPSATCLTIEAMFRLVSAGLLGAWDVVDGRPIATCCLRLRLSQAVNRRLGAEEREDLPY
jgi:hypothetical protein